MTRRNASKTVDQNIAVGYVRMSKEEQTLSPAVQRHAMAQWCEARGVRLVATCDDLDTCSVTPLEDRPGLLAALDAVRDNGAGLLLVAKRDRLSRDPILTAMVERLAERSGARLVSVAGEGTDADGPSDLLMRRIVDAFAEYERALIRCRTRDALAQLKRDGARLGGEALGWRRADDTDAAGRRVVEDVQTEAATVRRILDLRAEGLTLRDIAARLTADGCQTKRGGAWYASTVRAVLAREVEAA